MASAKTGMATQMPQTEDTPPAYFSVPLATPDSNRVLLNPALHLGDVDFRKYVIPQSTISEDRAITTTTLLQFYSDPPALVKLLHEQAALPPKPLLRIKGTHKSHYDTKVVVDFDLTLNLTPLLTPPGSQQVNCSRVPPATDGYAGEKVGSTQDVDEHRLQEWARRFCADKAGYKSFSLTRLPINFDTAFIEGRIRNLLAALQYRGSIDVTFPVTHSKVVIRKGSSLSQSFLGKLFVTNTSYDVTQVIWRHLTSSQLSEGTGSHPGDRFPHIEAVWWKTWESAIKNAMLDKQHGWISVEDWMEAAMGKKVAEPRTEWGIDE